MIGQDMADVEHARSTAVTQERYREPRALIVRAKRGNENKRFQSRFHCIENHSEKFSTTAGLAERNSGEDNVARRMVNTSGVRDQGSEELS
jgi:hypothetical protein